MLQSAVLWSPRSIRWQHIRAFSAQQAAAALRPFYFAVHPDRYARTPEIRSRNEKSLQIFNGYLNDLFPHNHASAKQPVKVIFSVLRDEKGTLEDVTLNLTSSDPHQVVEMALKKLNLSVEHLPRPKKQKQHPIPTHRTATTHAETSSGDSMDDLFWKLREANQKLRKKRASEVKPKDLFTNLTRLRETAVKQLNNHMKVKQHLQEDIDFVMVKTGATAITWEIEWEHTYMKRCIHNVENMISHATCDSERQSMLRAIRGHDVIFGRGTFVCCDGSLQFGADDVPEKWMKLCLEANVRRLELKKFHFLVARISELLESQVHFKPHDNLLKAIIQFEGFITKLGLKSKGELFELRRFACGSVIEVTDVYSTLAESNGVIHVPCNVDFRSLVEFFKKRYDDAREATEKTTASEATEKFQRRKEAVEELALSVRRQLRLRDITWDSSLSTFMITSVLTRLEQSDDNLRNAILGLSIHISNNPNIYVMNDGKLSIPVDFV